MQSYLFVGGAYDGLNFPLADDQDVVQLHVDVTGNENYLRDTLTVGDVAVTFYRHVSLTSAQVLDQLITHYKAWAVKRAGGRR
jgi:hypothetical protein